MDAGELERRDDRVAGHGLWKRRERGGRGGIRATGKLVGHKPTERVAVEAEPPRPAERPDVRDARELALHHHHKAKRERRAAQASEQHRHH